MKKWLILLAFLVACNDSVVGPDITVPNPTTTSAPPSRFDQQPDLYAIRGVTAFGAAQLSESQLISFINHVQGYGVNTLRVGASTNGWCSSPRSFIQDCCGPAPGSPEWTENLERLLRVTARFPNIYVQLIPTFTHKQHGAAKCWEVLEATVAIQQEHSYQHVIWETVNEWKHPISKLSLGDVVNMTRRLRETGQPVGCDYGGGRDDPWQGEYPGQLLPYVDYVAFHPPRNTYRSSCEKGRPGASRLRKVISSYAKPVWIDEPECYISDVSKIAFNIGPSGLYSECGLQTEQQRQWSTLSYMRDVERAGGIWFTHAVWLFACDRLGWLPS